MDESNTAVMSETSEASVVTDPVTKPPIAIKGRGKSNVTKVAPSSSSKKVAKVDVVTVAKAGDRDRSNACFGHSVSQVARRLGYWGFNAKQALKALADFSSTPSAIVTGVSDGYSTKYGRMFKQANLSKKDEALLRKAIGTPPVREARTFETK